MEETNEQYFDRLAKGTWRDKTPGFRAFLLDIMEELGPERPRDGEISQMHFAYQAGVAYQKESMATPRPEPQPVTPRPGQVWQRLNVGTKMASKALRITIDEVVGSMVHGRSPGAFRRMRIATLQRDWHCLNPDI